MTGLSTISYTLKSNIPRIVAARIQLSMCDPMSISYEDIIIVLWRWTFGYEKDCDIEIDPTTLLDILRSYFGTQSIEEYEESSYKITLPNSTWYLTDKAELGYNIVPCRPDKSSISMKMRVPHVTVAYMKEFDRCIPQVHEWIDETLSQKAQENILCDMTAVTGKAILEEVVKEEGLNVPAIISLRGTHQGRVLIRFTTGEEINCPMDYLRSQLIRRFKPGFRRKR